MKLKIKHFLALVIVLLVGTGIYVISNKSPTANVVSDSFREEIVPGFTLPSTTGDKISLSDYKGKKNVLLYFQEGVMCDPCWQQTLDIQKEYDKFQAMDIELITITVDPLNAITKNAKRFGITLPILADEDLKVSSGYDVLKDAMHPGERPGHTFVLIDKSGKVVWRKAYFKASGSTKMTMNMNGRPMTMDMGMDMGTPDSVMYVPVDKLLEDLKSANLEFSNDDVNAGHEMSNSDMPTADHTMCLTPIHKHVDFKMYLSDTPLNFSQKQYMEQSNKMHFHSTVKVRPEDIPNMPFAELFHVHEESLTLRYFFGTLDLPFDVNNMEGLKVYANGKLESLGLDYIPKDKDRILVTDTNDEVKIRSQIESVSDYTIQGRDANPSLFGGC